MKKLLMIISICLLTNNLFSKYNGFMDDYFFGRQPGARAEAMGKGYVSIGGDVNSNYYNPAGVSLIESTNFNFNNASRYYMLDKANYSFVGLGFNYNKLLKIGISRFNYTMIDKITITNVYNTPIFQYTPYTSCYTISIASNPISNFHIGLNTNLILKKTSDNSPDKSLLFDLGFIEIIPLVPESETINSIQIGGSINNMFNSKIKLSNKGGIIGPTNPVTYDLPVISRVGLCYKYGIGKNISIYNLRLFQLLAQFEYQKILNYNYYTAFREGGEINVLEILALRCGYFTESLETYNNPNNYDSLQEFTYGFGLNFPIDKLTNNKIKLNIKIDYTNLPQPRASKINYHFDNFNSFGINANYRL